MTDASSPQRWTTARETGVIQRVRASLARHVGGAPHILVGYSGGRDSLALSAIVASLVRARAMSAELVHVHHGVRVASDEEIGLVAGVAAALELPLRVIRLDQDRIASHAGVGAEEAMRRERFLGFARVARESGAAAVALAHHQRDQAETVLLHLIRGAGLDGATGMREWADLTVPWWDTTGPTHALTVWRPLLDERQDLIAAVAVAAGLPIAEDESNADRRFRRNAIRHDLLPVIERIQPGATGNIARFADLAAEDNAELERLATEAFGIAVKDGALDRAFIAELSPALARRVVRLWLTLVPCDGDRTADRIDAVVGAARRNRSGSRIELGGGWGATLRSGRFVPEPGPVASGPRPGTMAVDGATGAPTTEIGMPPMTTAPSQDDAIAMPAAPSEPKARGVSRILIGEEQIQREIRAMAQELDEEYADESPLMVGVLTGAVAFMADLVKAMSIPLVIDFMAVSSYGSATKSSGVVRILKDLNDEIEGRRVVVVEDIVDSGLTLQYLLDVLGRRNPKDIRVVALVKKDKPDAVDVQVDRIGFTVPDEFVVGYGLDYAGEYRNLPYIAVLDSSVYGTVGKNS